MNLQVPRIIQATAGAQSQIADYYPGFVSFLSEEFVKDQTMFVVDGDKNIIKKPWVDDLGVMHINITYFHFMAEVMKEFFSTYKQGIDMRLAFEGLIRLLSGGFNGKKEETRREST